MVALWYLRDMRQLNRHFRTLQSLYKIFFWFKIEDKPPLLYIPRKKFNWFINWIFCVYNHHGIPNNE